MRRRPGCVIPSSSKRIHWQNMNWFSAASWDRGESYGNYDLSAEFCTMQTARSDSVDNIFKLCLPVKYFWFQPPPGCSLKTFRAAFNAYLAKRPWTVNVKFFNFFFFRIWRRRRSVLRVQIFLSSVLLVRLHVFPWASVSASFTKYEGRSDGLLATFNRVTCSPWISGIFPGAISKYVNDCKASPS